MSTYTFQKTGTTLTLLNAASVALWSDPAWFPPTTCFLRGTRIATPEGWKEIEALQIGDKITASDGGAYTVAEVQKTTVNAEEQGSEPYVIRAGFLGAERDLYLTPRHGVLFEGKVVPAGNLSCCDKAGIVGIVDYFHVRIADADADKVMLLAEGVACESLRRPKEF